MHSGAVGLEESSVLRGISFQTTRGEAERRSREVLLSVAGWERCGFDPERPLSGRHAGHNSLFLPRASFHLRLYISN